MNLFLKAKHWQIFLFTFALPTLLQIITIILLIIDEVSHPHSEAGSVSSYMSMIPLIMVIALGGNLAWMWSVGNGLQRKLPFNIKLKVRRFRVFLIYPMVYMFFFLWFMFSLMQSTGAENFSPNWLLLIVPFHLFAMFCMIHSLYFVAKTLKSVELGREASFSDYIGEFFLIWFFPIGVWIIQPKVNQMIAGPFAGPPQ